MILDLYQEISTLQDLLRRMVDQMEEDNQVLDADRGPSDRPTVMQETQEYLAKVPKVHSAHNQSKPWTLKGTCRGCATLEGNEHAPGCKYT